MATNNSSSIRTLLAVVAVSLGAAILVTGTYEFSVDRIEFNERQRLLASLDSVLTENLRSADLVTKQLEVTDAELLGTGEPVDVFVMLAGNEPRAAVIAAVAPDGYNAPIRMLVGVLPDGTISGVRVVSHRETPGLGDAIEIAKSDWILQFDSKRLGAPEVSEWAVDKDDGRFDSLTGATITPRAIVNGVKNTLLYFRENGPRLFRQAQELQAENSNDE